MILRTNMYCKSASCPSSENVLAYVTCGLATDQRNLVAVHLDECDFCGAEFQLLSEHVPFEERECPLVEMPSNLRFLAQSLLTGDWLNIESMAETAFEKERLTLTDA